MVAQNDLAFIMAIATLELSPGLLRELRKRMASGPKRRTSLLGEANGRTGAPIRSLSTAPIFGSEIFPSERSTKQLK
jgi:hypothetical protein